MNPHLLAQAKLRSTSAYVSSDLNGQTSYARNQITLGSGSIITNDYDPSGRLTNTVLKTSGGIVLNYHQYIYNQGNQRTRHERGDGAYMTYRYDDLGQIYSSRTTNSSSSLVASETRGYDYDAAWNMLKRTNNTVATTYTVNSLNQLTASSGATMSYDGNGNRTVRDTGSQIIYGYDDENQLTSIATDTSYTPQASRWKSEFVYDGKQRLRRRIDYLHNGSWYVNGETRFIYDGMLVIQERNSGNVPQVSYTRGLDLSGSLQGAGGIGGMLARSHAYSSGTWATNNYYHADGNGNITYLAASGETLAASYKYDPFGNIIASSGNVATANLYRFSSKMLFVNVPMYYYGYRWYDVGNQRWLNRDPLGEEGGETIRTKGKSFWQVKLGGIYIDEPSPAEISEGSNLYTFVKNSPIMEVDPIGLFLGFGYGNWCGWSRSGQGGGGHKDDVDLACKNHDNCLATWQEACKMKLCNIKFCSEAAKADCKGDSACKKAKTKILVGCAIIVPIPPFIIM